MDGAGVANKRCAIYCRKSSEEGLEQEFNSLDAQYEACAAFIGSQRFEGWSLLERRYEDGGKSGGNLDRPALQQLIADIENSLVQIVVVYKVDRLTRSLADFAKLVEIFDRHGVSFVSVTQQFNTTSSMGRLTLNVLLSFAQYEREVTAERIRDKIAASKKKGMWMGGVPPLGYEPDGRTLKIVAKEAEQVRTLFRLYLELGCVRKLQSELEYRGIRSKRWQTRNGRRMGGKVISRGSLYKILNNPIYIGQIRHREELHQGQHDAIIDESLWQDVQSQLARNVASKARRQKTLSPLAGLLFDEHCNGFTPSHANKKGRRYRYYVNRAVLQNRQQDAGSVHRISAPRIEGLVSNWLLGLLTDQPTLQAWIVDAKPGISTSDLSTNLDTAKALSEQIAKGKTVDLVQSVIVRITVTTVGLSIRYNQGALLNKIGVKKAGSSVQEISVQTNLKRRHSEDKLIIASGHTHKDLPLIKMLVQAHGWLDLVRGGKARTVADIAKRVGMQESYIYKHLKLALLAPDIQKSILDGTQPRSVTLDTLRAGDYTQDWNAQRCKLGF